MRTSSKSSFWAVAVLLSGAAAFGSACSSSGSDNRNGTAGTGNAASGGTQGLAGSIGAGGTGLTSSTGGSGGVAAVACDGDKMCCPTMNCPCPFPQGDGTSDVISNVDDGKTTFVTATVAKALGHWDFSRDASMGTVVPTGNATLTTFPGGANGTANAMHVTGMNLTGWGAALAAELSNGCPFDGSKYGGISFYAKGTSTVAEGANKLLVLVGNPEYLPKPAGFCDGAAVPADPACYSRHRVLIDLTPDWKQYVIAWTDLAPPSYYTSGPAFGPDRITDIVFNASGPSPAATPAASFDYWVDELAFVPPGTVGNVTGGGSAGASAGGASAGGTGGAAAAGTGGAAAGGTGGAAAGTGGSN